MRVSGNFLTRFEVKSPFGVPFFHSNPLVNYAIILRSNIEINIRNSFTLFYLANFRSGNC